MNTRAMVDEEFHHVRNVSSELRDDPHDLRGVSPTALGKVDSERARRIVELEALVIEQNSQIAALKLELDQWQHVDAEVQKRSGGRIASFLALRKTIQAQGEAGYVKHVKRGKGST